MMTAPAEKLSWRRKLSRLGHGESDSWEMLTGQVHVLLVQGEWMIPARRRLCQSKIAVEWLGSNAQSEAERCVSMSRREDGSEEACTGLSCPERETYEGAKQHQQRAASVAGEEEQTSLDYPEHAEAVEIEEEWKTLPALKLSVLRERLQELSAASRSTWLASLL